MQFSFCCFLAVSLLSCSEDEPVAVKTKNTNGYRAATTAENVMFNFVKAYNGMDADHYEALFASDYHFRFDVTAVGYPSVWDVKDEMTATRHMFGGAVSGDSRFGKVLGVKITLLFDENSWTDVPAALRSDGEECRRATVSYQYEINVEPDWTFVNGDEMDAEFTLRKASDGSWKIVEWDDKGFGCGGDRRMAATTSCEWNWGQVKSLYLYDD